mmetsp:Transcript_18491/g.49582  ORF Transcript_18491/g.49582 Transcript_18491/m.49582 type:complete len:273 (+) Transcript_18491:551-1369(+)
MSDLAFHTTVPSLASDVPLQLQIDGRPREIMGCVVQQSVGGDIRSQSLQSGFDASVRKLFRLAAGHRASLCNLHESSHLAQQTCSDKAYVFVNGPQNGLLTEQAVECTTLDVFNDLLHRHLDFRESREDWKNTQQMLIDDDDYQHHVDIALEEIPSEPHTSCFEDIQYGLQHLQRFEVGGTDGGGLTAKVFSDAGLDHGPRHKETVPQLMFTGLQVQISCRWKLVQEAIPTHKSLTGLYAEIQAVTKACERPDVEDPTVKHLFESRVDGHEH